jgi:Protein of unknown function (DUF4035)
MTVGRLMRELTVREFAYWQVHYREDPFGEDRGDVRSAQVAAILANSNRDPKKRDKPFEVIDFMPYAKRRQDAEQKQREEQQEDEGAKVDPMTFAWLTAMARKTAKHGK